MLEKHRYQFIAIASALTLSVFALMSHAQGQIGAGDRLSFMQKIQGTWKGACVPGVGGMKLGYQQPTVTISFTHITIEMQLYKGSDCLHKKGQFTQKYLYKLGQPVQTKSGESAVELDLALDHKTAPDKPAVDALQWAKLNLIRFHDGGLYFGRQPAIERSERLDYLDLTYPYHR